MNANTKFQSKASNRF